MVGQCVKRDSAAGQKNGDPFLVLIFASSRIPLGRSYPYLRVGPVVSFRDNNSSLKGFYPYFLIHTRVTRVIIRVSEGIFRILNLFMALSVKNAAMNVSSPMHLQRRINLSKKLAVNPSERDFSNKKKYKIKW